MTSGIQEMLALAIVALIVGAFLFRRFRARRRRKEANEASVSADRIGRRHQD